MADAFSFFAGALALAAPILAGPAGPLEIDQALAPYASERAGASTSAQVLYANGELAGHVGNDKATMRFEDLPKGFIDALTAVEDAQFYRHHGVDPTGTARALIGVATGVNRGGGSTLSQQLAKNVVTGSRVTPARKLAEIISAIATETVASKEEILESYANAVFFGRRAQGGAEAARNWFGKDWNDLSLEEVAFLAGVLQAPSFLDPLRNPDAAKARRDHVIDRMRAVGVISDTVAEKLRESPLSVSPPPPRPTAPLLPQTHDFWTLVDARRFLDTQRLEHVAAQGGFVTTLRLEFQEAAQEAIDTELGRVNAQIGEAPIASIPVDDPTQWATIDDSTWARVRASTPLLPEGATRAVYDGARLHLEDADLLTRKPEPPQWLRRPGVYVVLSDGSVRGKPIVQGAVFAVDTRTGEPVAAIGGIAPWASQFDRTMARRQPGSSIKPFVWLAGLEDGLIPTAFAIDAPTEFPDGPRVWRPRNYSGEFSGAVTIFSAFEKSLNVVSARIAFDVGMVSVRETLQLANVYPENEDRLDNLSASIGTIETTPRRMAMGMLAIDTDAGYIGTRRSRLDLERMMRGVTVRGTAARAFRDGPGGVAGKTGTTQSYRDAWFVGRTGNLAFAVWVGRDDDRPLPRVDGRRGTGSSLAAPVAAAFLRNLEGRGIDIAPLSSRPFEEVGAGLRRVPSNAPFEPTEPEVSARFMAELPQAEVSFADEWDDFEIIELPPLAPDEDAEPPARFEFRGIY